MPHLPGVNYQMFDYNVEKVAEAVAIVAGLALLCYPWLGVLRGASTFLQHGDPLIFYLILIGTLIEF